MRYYRRMSEEGDINFRAMGKTRYEPDWDEDRVAHVDATLKLKSGTRSDPHVFDSLFADHTLRGAVPTVAALTLNSVRSFAPEHRHVAPSESLSRFSSPLVRKAQSMGLVVPSHSNPGAGVTNSVGVMGASGPFSWTISVGEHGHMQHEAKHGNGTLGGTDAVGWYPWEEVHHSEVGQARTMVRQIMSTRSQQRSSRLSDEQLGRVLHEGNIFG